MSINPILFKSTPYPVPQHPSKSDTPPSCWDTLFRSANCKFKRNNRWGKPFTTPNTSTLRKILVATLGLTALAAIGLYIRENSLKTQINGILANAEPKESDCRLAFKLAHELWFQPKEETPNAKNGLQLEIDQCFSKTPRFAKLKEKDKLTDAFIQEFCNQLNQDFAHLHSLPLEDQLKTITELAPWWSAKLQEATSWHQNELLNIGTNENKQEITDGQ